MSFSPSVEHPIDYHKIIKNAILGNNGNTPEIIAFQFMRQSDHCDAVLKAFKDFENSTLSQALATEKNEETKKEINRRYNAFRVFFTKVNLSYYEHIRELAKQDLIGGQVKQDTPIAISILEQLYEHNLEQNIRDFYFVPPEQGYTPAIEADDKLWFCETNKKGETKPSGEAHIKKVVEDYLLHGIPANLNYIKSIIRLDSFLCDSVAEVLQQYCNEIEFYPCHTHVEALTSLLNDVRYKEEITKMYVKSIDSFSHSRDEYIKHYIQGISITQFYIDKDLRALSLLNENGERSFELSEIPLLTSSPLIDTLVKLNLADIEKFFARLKAQKSSPGEALACPEDFQQLLRCCVLIKKAQLIGDPKILLQQFKIVAAMNSYHFTKQVLHYMFSYFANNNSEFYNYKRLKTIFSILVKLLYDKNEPPTFKIENGKLESINTLILFYQSLVKNNTEIKVSKNPMGDILPTMLSTIFLQALYNTALATVNENDRNNLLGHTTNCITISSRPGKGWEEFFGKITDETRIFYIVGSKHVDNRYLKLLLTAHPNFVDREQRKEITMLIESYESAEKITKDPEELKKYRKFINDRINTHYNFRCLDLAILKKLVAAPEVQQTKMLSQGEKEPKKSPKSLFSGLRSPRRPREENKNSKATATSSKSSFLGLFSKKTTAATPIIPNTTAITTTDTASDDTALNQSSEDEHKIIEEFNNRAAAIVFNDPDDDYSIVLQDIKKEFLGNLLDNNDAHKSQDSVSHFLAICGGRVPLEAFSEDTSNQPEKEEFRVTPIEEIKSLTLLKEIYNHCHRKEEALENSSHQSPHI